MFLKKRNQLNFLEEIKHFKMRWKKKTVLIKKKKKKKRKN